MSIDLLARIPSPAKVVVVEFRLLHQIEAMTSVEAVRITATKRANADCATVIVCTCEYRLKRVRADA